MADKLMYIPNYDTQNYLLCKLQLVVETFGNSIKWTLKSQRLLSQRIINRYFNTLGTNKQPNAHSLSEKTWPAWWNLIISQSAWLTGVTVILSARPTHWSSGLSIIASLVLQIGMSKTGPISTVSWSFVVPPIIK